MKNTNKSLKSLVKSVAVFVMAGSIVCATTTQAFASYAQGNIKIEHIWQDDNNSGNTRPDTIKEDVTPNYKVDSGETPTETGKEKLDLEVTPPKGVANKEDTGTSEEGGNQEEPGTSEEGGNQEEPGTSEEGGDREEPGTSEEGGDKEDPSTSEEGGNQENPGTPEEGSDSEDKARNDYIEDIRKDLVAGNEVNLDQEKVDLIINGTNTGLDGDFCDVEKDNLSVAVNMVKNDDQESLDFTITTEDKTDDNPVTYKVTINDVSEKELKDAGYVTQQLKIAIDVVNGKLVTEPPSENPNSGYVGSVSSFGEERYYVSYDNENTWLMKVTEYQYNEDEDEYKIVGEKYLKPGEEGYVPYDPAKDYVINTVYTFLHILAPTHDTDSTPKTTDLTVYKEWKDDNSANRPTSVKVQLVKNGADEGDSIELNDGNGWKYTWGGLDKFIGDEFIKWTVRELDVPGYTPSYTTSEDGTVVTITNTLKPTDPPDDPPDNPRRDHDPKPDPKPEEPPVEVPEPEVPLAPTPEEPPVVEVPEPDVPLAEEPPVDVPEEEAPPVVDIPEPEVPLADVPETGDASGMWYGVALLAACGLVVMNLRKKAEENN